MKTTKIYLNRFFLSFGFLQRFRIITETIIKFLSALFHLNSKTVFKDGVITSSCLNTYKNIKPGVGHDFRLLSYSMCHLFPDSALKFSWKILINRVFIISNYFKTLKKSKKFIDQRPGNQNYVQLS
ncbi:hypothetical protein BpHYR1_030712 [Brachionus plicatilis]|uniref:Uncharacterized protein n=1 Tax=Brachionus plicatilis TaxID=10195 RepID=A0A3M7QAL5_BRAPC|nr:hypothetical protein BpHYR1_030712 [Brachionus plicatilis]